MAKCFEQKNSAIFGATWGNYFPSLSFLDYIHCFSHPLSLSAFRTKGSRTAWYGAKAQGQGQKKEERREPALVAKGRKRAPGLKIATAEESSREATLKCIGRENRGPLAAASFQPSHRSI